jgi:hypothetical protein
MVVVSPSPIAPRCGERSTRSAGVELIRPFAATPPLVVWAEIEPIIVLIVLKDADR